MPPHRHHPTPPLKKTSVHKEMRELDKQAGSRQQGQQNKLKAYVYRASPVQSKAFTAARPAVRQGFPPPLPQQTFLRYR